MRFYHGTDAETAERILEGGLRPGSDGVVHLTRSPSYATSWGPVVLEVSPPGGYVKLQREPYTGYVSKKIIPPEYVKIWEGWG